MSYNKGFKANFFIKHIDFFSSLFLFTENSKSDYTLFQAATTIKEAIIRDWSLMNPDSIEALRSFLLRYITNHITLQVILK